MVEPEHSRAPGREPDAEPDGPASSDPGSAPPPGPEQVGTAEELRAAVFGMVPHSQDRAVQNKTGLGKTTVNELRRGTRRFTRDSLEKLVVAYDPDRREQWLAAWARIQRPPSPTSPTGLVSLAETAPSAPDPSAPDPAADRPGEPDVGTSHDSAAEAGPPATGRGPSRRVRRMLIAGALLVIGAIVAVGAISLGSQRSALVRTPGLPGAICPQPPLQTAAPVTFQKGSARFGVSVVALSYTYTPAFSPMIELGGGLSGPLPPGQRLFVVSWSDPASTDSTPKKNPGNGRYYPYELQLSRDLCFSQPRGEMGYGGFTGMRVREYLMLVDDARAATFEQQGNAQDGFTENDLAQRGAVSLGYTEIQTRNRQPSDRR